FCSTTRMELRWRATTIGKLTIERAPHRKQRCVPAVCNRPTIWNRPLLPASLLETTPPLSWEKTTPPASPWLKSIICLEPTTGACWRWLTFAVVKRERQDRARRHVWHVKETTRKKACQHENVARHAQFDIKLPIIDQTLSLV